MKVPPPTQESPVRHVEAMGIECISPHCSLVLDEHILIYFTLLGGSVASQKTKRDCTVGISALAPRWRIRNPWAVPGNPWWLPLARLE